MAEFQNAVRACEPGQQRPPWADTPCRHQDVGQKTQRAIEIFMLSKKDDGEMGGIGHWQTANGYTAMVLHDRWSRNAANYRILDQQIRMVERHHPGLINEFNDDTLWWAMCCMHMYNINSDEWYLNTAKNIWQHVRKFVVPRGKINIHDMDMEGGVFWTSKPDEGHLNSITTGLFAELSARLALIERANPSGSEEGGSSEHHGFRDMLKSKLSHGSKGASSEEYVQTAKQCLGWILRCRYRPRDAIVLDTIRTKIRELVDWTFSYNTGVAMGVCSLLYQLTKDQEYLTLACNLARKAMVRPNWVEGDGTLTEMYRKGQHQAEKNDDAIGFRAVLMRHLAMLYEMLITERPANQHAEETAGLIKAFILTNFNSLQERNTNGNGQYGPWWTGPFEAPTSHSQLPAMDVMAAVRLVT